MAPVTCQVGRAEDFPPRLNQEGLLRCKAGLTCGAVQERAEQLHLCLQLGQAEVDRLVVENRQLEDLPLACVLDGLLDNVVHHGQNWMEAGSRDVGEERGRLLVKETTTGFQ